MKIVVQKFGGSSVANKDKLFNVCKHIIKEKDKNSGVVVVVSAQGDMTDKLISEELEIGDSINSREHDVLVTVGEQITVSKLVMCLNSLGYKAISLLGWQVPIITNSKYGDADIIDVKIDNIMKKLNDDFIVVVAGFQGIDYGKNITTLGRGGSDTTAIALAASLNANECIIFKDVDGVYTDDPNENKEATRYENISYDKMIDMANKGAKILHNKSVIMAKENHMKIIVRSTFENNDNETIIGD